MKVVQLVSGILLFVAVAVYAVHLQVAVVQLGYELHSTEKERRDLEESNRQLRAAIAQKRQPQRLAEAARELGLPIMPPEERTKKPTKR